MRQLTVGPHSAMLRIVGDRILGLIFVLRAPIFVTLTLLGSVAIGLAQVRMPFVGPGLLVGLVVLPLVLLAPYHLLLSGVLVLLIWSRLLLLIGAPALVTYAHFALFLVVLLKLIYLPSPLTAETRKILMLTGLLALAIAASAIVSGWVQLRPLLLWLVLAEPFIMYGLMRGLGEAERTFVMWTALWSALIQIPFAFLQFAQYGTGDFVKGTLIRQGAGHHIVGAIGVMGAVLWLTEAKRIKLPTSALTVAIPLLLMSIGVLSDAKQVYAALAIAIVPTVLYLTRHKPLVGVAIVMFPVVFIAVGSQFNESLSKVGSREVIQENIDLKLSYLDIVGNYLSPETTAFGLGPGQGASRVAMLTLPDYGSVPELLVGNRPAELAKELTQADRDYWGVNQGSSMNSPFNSVLGLFADVGIVGCLAYAWLGVTVWRSMNDRLPLQQRLGKSLLLFALVLGLLFTWLDEPGFSVFLAVTLASLSTTHVGETASARRRVAEPPLKHARLTHAYPQRP